MGYALNTTSDMEPLIPVLQMCLLSFQKTINMSITQGIERIPDSLGFLVINEDGGVISVSALLTILATG